MRIERMRIIQVVAVVEVFLDSSLSVEVELINGKYSRIVRAMEALNTDQIKEIELLLKDYFVMCEGVLE